MMTVTHADLTFLEEGQTNEYLYKVISGKLDIMKNVGGGRAARVVNNFSQFH